MRKYALTRVEAEAFLALTEDIHMEVEEEHGAWRRSHGYAFAINSPLSTGAFIDLVKARKSSC